MWKTSGEHSGCPATTYFTGYQYSKLCERVIGYQVGTLDVFRAKNILDLTGLTSPMELNAIMFVAGHYDMRNSSSDYPCSSMQARMPPQFIGDNYYCEG